MQPVHTIRSSDPCSRKLLCRKSALTCCVLIGNHLSQVEVCAPPPASCSMAASTPKSSDSGCDDGSGSAASAGCRVGKLLISCMPYGT